MKKAYGNNYVIKDLLWVLFFVDFSLEIWFNIYGSEWLVIMDEITYDKVLDEKSSKVKQLYWNIAFGLQRSR